MKTTPQEYADELIEKYYLCMPFKDVKLTSCKENPILIIKMEKLSAKQCALNDVQNTIEEFMWTSLLINTDSPDKKILTDKIEYFQEVKTEIEKL